MEFTIEEKIEILMRRVSALERKVEELTPREHTQAEIDAMVEEDMK